MFKELLKGAFIILFVSVVAKIISYITEAILASILGASDIGDAYFMVIGIQYVLYPMLSVGIWKVFLPIYKKIQVADQKVRLNMFSDTIITIFIVLSIITVGGIMSFSSRIVSVIAPGFSYDTKAMCSRLLFVSTPMYIFIVIAAIYAAMLQCHNKFFASQIREVISHLPTIIVCLFLYKKYGYISLGYGLLLGGISRLAIELFFVDWKYRFKPRVIINKDMFAFFKAFPATFIAEGVIHLNMMIDKIMASTLATGAISVLNYGSRLTNVLSGLVSNSLATAFYPKMSELIARKQFDKLSSAVNTLIKLYCLIIIPISIGCIAFRTEIVSVAFQRGQFDGSSVAMTAGTFSCYSSGLFFLASNTIFNNILYSYGETKKTMYVSIYNLVINVIANLMLISAFKANGLAIATSIAAFLTFFIRIYYMRGLVSINLKTISIRFVTILFVSALICFAAKRIVFYFPVNKYILLSLEVVICSALYLCFLFFSKFSEIVFFSDLIKSKLKKRVS